MRTAGDLDSGVRSLRMVPFAEAGQGLERTVRDLALAAGKEVVFKLVGHEVELDRAVAERLKDPLLHLVRNAVDHGIEPPAERAAAGKPRGGHHHRLRRPEGRAGGDRDHRRRTRPRPAAHPRGSARAGTARVRRGSGSPGPRVPPRPLHGARPHRRLRPRRRPRRGQEPGERPPRHGGARIGRGRGDDVRLDRALDGHAHPGPARGVGRAHVRAGDHAGDGPAPAHPRGGPQRGRPGDAGRDPRTASPRLAGGSPRAAGAPPRPRAGRLRRAGRGGDLAGRLRGRRAAGRAGPRRHRPRPPPAPRPQRRGLRLAGRRRHRPHPERRRAGGERAPGARAAAS